MKIAVQHKAVVLCSSTAVMSTAGVQFGAAKHHATAPALARLLLYMLMPKGRQLSSRKHLAKRQKNCN